MRPDHIQALYNRKVNAGVGLYTIQIIHALLRRSLNQAVKLGLLTSNPSEATSPPKPQQREMQILDDSQILLLLNTAKALGDRNLALYQLALTAGMRQGEMLGLKWQDVDWEQRTLQIQRQLTYLSGSEVGFYPPKTKSSVRLIAIGQITISFLKEHRQRQRIEIARMGKRWQDYDLVFPSKFGKPLIPSNLFRSYKGLLKKAGLPNIRFHDLRHTAASLMLNHGIPVLIVSKRLGHAKPSITLDVYGHLIPSMQEQAAQIIEEAVIKKKLDPVAPGLHQKASVSMKSPK